MIYVLILLFIASTIAGDNKLPKLELQAPSSVLSQGTFNVTCKGRNLVSVKVHHCPIISKSPCQYKDGFFIKTFHVVHVQKDCVVQCFSGQEEETKKVMVIDGVITSKNHSTVLKGLPFTVTCETRCKSDLYHVIWATNKTSKFVNNDKEHTVWSSPPFKDTQYHHMTVHSASSSTNYQCKLIDVTGRTIDSAEQHVYVEEPENNMVEMVINYIKPYLRWATE